MDRRSFRLGWTNNVTDARVEGEVERLIEEVEWKG